MASFSTIQSVGITAADCSASGTTLAGSETSSDRRASVEAFDHEALKKALFPTGLHVVDSHKVTHARNLHLPVLETPAAVFSHDVALYSARQICGDSVISFSDKSSASSSRRSSTETVGNPPHLNLSHGLSIVDSNQVVRNRSSGLKTKKTHAAAKKAAAIASKIARGIKKTAHFVKEALTEQPGDWDLPIDRPARISRQVTQAQYDEAAAVRAAREKKALAVQASQTAKRMVEILAAQQEKRRDWITDACGLGSMGC